VKTINVHLVSDSTGDTVRSVARACLVQFEAVEPVEHFWVLVRSPGQMKRVIEGISAYPGLVLCTVVDEALRRNLEEACIRMGVPFVAMLDPVIASLGLLLDARSVGEPGRQHALDTSYFNRIEAMNYTMAHDDGQSTWNLNEADVILVGVSRTSKTPTCIYLANRGLKVANVPFVPEIELPAELLEVKEPLIVGLVVDPARLVQVRRNRLLTLKEDPETTYTDLERVQEEVTQARRFFTRHGWPTIDVTRRSIEETAAAVVQLHSKRLAERGAPHA
jgi:regulator of PEP synthase PpsR (kinase-PPPase family)